MIGIHIQIDIGDLISLSEFSENGKKEIDAAILDGAHLVRNTAVKGISQGTRSGRLYRRGRIIHRASAPFEYPKTDTGRLVSSIRVDHGFLRSEVGSDVIYSSYLEEGTKNMFPRPWLKPSFDRNANEIERLVDQAIERALSK